MLFFSFSFFLSSFWFLVFAEHPILILYFLLSGIKLTTPYSPWKIKSPLTPKSLIQFYYTLLKISGLSCPINSWDRLTLLYLEFHFWNSVVLIENVFFKSFIIIISFISSSGRLLNHLKNIIFCLFFCYLWLIILNLKI